MIEHVPHATTEAVDEAMAALGEATRAYLHTYQSEGRTKDGSYAGLSLHVIHAMGYLAGTAIRACTVYDAWTAAPAKE